MPSLRLPTAAGGLESFAMSPPSPFPAHGEGDFPRIVYAAAHVVADARAGADPWRSESVV